MNKVAILGATGLLGSMLLEHFASEEAIDVVATVRDAQEAARLGPLYPRVTFHCLQADCATEADIVGAIEDAKWVINAIGLIKQRIVESDWSLVERAVRTNAIFSFVLARAALQAQFKVIQVATDCVFSGETGSYSETAVHDGYDVYGKSKSLGEVQSEAVINLRCSIVGPERSGGPSLLNWFLSQKPGAQVNGFADHYWNGITTLHFARICSGIVRSGIRLPTMQHVVPADAVSKDELLRLFARCFRREDIVINPLHASTIVDRTLTTNSPAINEAIWNVAGYDQIPLVSEMVAELANTVIGCRPVLRSQGGLSVHTP
jgi:dTDP-4-dehydrorhamnose reductase